MLKTGKKKNEEELNVSLTYGLFINFEGTIGEWSLNKKPPRIFTTSVCFSFTSRRDNYENDESKK